MNSSGNKGINKYKNGFTATLYVNKETIYLGAYKTIEEAIEAREKAKEHFGIIDDTRTKKEKQRDTRIRNKEKINQSILEWRKKNPEKVRSYKTRYRKNNNEEIKTNKNATRRKLKIEVLNIYGGICECCGITEIDFLTIDHANNDGAQHRRDTSGPKQAGFTFYRWLQKNNFPKDLGLRVLCWNCNCARAYSPNKKCPHEIERENNNVVAE